MRPNRPFKYNWIYVRYWRTVFNKNYINKRILTTTQQNRSTTFLDHLSFSERSCKIVCQILKWGGYRYWSLVFVLACTTLQLMCFLSSDPKTTLFQTPQNRGPRSTADHRGRKKSKTCKHTSLKTNQQPSIIVCAVPGFSTLHGTPPCRWVANFLSNPWTHDGGSLPPSCMEARKFSKLSILQSLLKALLSTHQAHPQVNAPALITMKNHNEISFFFGRGQ